MSEPSHVSINNVDIKKSSVFSALVANLACWLNFSKTVFKDPVLLLPWQSHISYYLSSWDQSNDNLTLALGTYLHTEPYLLCPLSQAALWSIWDNSWRKQSGFLPLAS